MEIDTAARNQYRDTFELLTQQMDSEMEIGVDIEDGMVPGEQKFVDQIGPLDFVQLTGRHSDTVITDPGHFRRVIIPVPFTVASLIDKQDQVRAVGDPQSKYSQSILAGSNRLKDDTIIAALTGTAFTGKAGGTSTALPAAQTIAVDFVEDGTTSTSNMTLGKLREAKQRLDTNDVLKTDRFISLSPDNLQGLLRDPIVTSIDHAAVKALVMGEIDTFLGFKFITSTRLAVASNVRSAIAWQKRGTAIGFAENFVARIDELPTKHYATQVYGRSDLGASRLEEVTVVEILADETK